MNGYHKIYRDKTLFNARVGELGSMVYLLSEDGDRMTNGHHKLFFKDGELYGKTGSQVELITDRKAMSLFRIEA